ncbi:RWD domain-containing protein 3-like isoform X2 [Uloborus diversus]|uniref:RWD domain-containing protein 3-like isoform X2 n=1 Tax=Uloborus diversus TaxID=327109 RepID=UPI00240913C7|nr:RWD domain-containing protein 3-like isoform X2 [Uloborus diversus]
MDLCFEEELECLMSSYDEKEFSYCRDVNNLTNSEKLRAQNKVQDHATNMKGSYMIMDLVNEAHGIVSSALPQTLCVQYPSSSEEEKTHIAIILIDHMRQRNKYIKTISNWVKDLSLNGMLLYSPKQSILIVQGFKMQLKDFTTRLRTVCVDVDAAGRACKERMSKVLFEGLCSCKFSEFRVQEISAIGDLETYFFDMKLGSYYQEYIKPVRPH